MPTWFPYVDLIVRLSTLIVGIIAVIIAGRGLRTWHRQLHGQVNLEIARKLTTAVYTFRNVIEEVREEMLDSRIDALLKKYRKARSRFIADTLEAHVLWGEDVSLVINQLSMSGNKVFKLARMMARINEKFEGQRRTPEATERFEQLESEMGGFDDGEGNVDDITRRITKAIRKLHEIVDPHLPRDYREQLERVAEQRDAEFEKV
jgi:hypothetical protein